MPDALLADPDSELTVHEAFTGPKATAPFEGVIGVEGMLTGDGRLIAADSLEWAAFPLPLRWAAADFGGHDGAVVVGRIDRIERRENGDIYAWGVLDLGSKDGREVARLMRGQFLSGVSMDLDSVDAVEGQLSMTSEDGTQITAPNVLVTQEARVRAATIVSIPAFDEARLALVASMGAGYRVVVGHAAWELTFATVADELAARTKGRLQLAATERTARAARLQLAADAVRFSPATRRAREVAALAAKVEVVTGHRPEHFELTGETETFAFNPLQWRDPANGHWIDMPGVAIGKFLEGIFGKGGPDHANAPAATRMGSNAAAADHAIQSGDLASGQASAGKVLDDMQSILDSKGLSSDDPSVADSVTALEAVENANSFETGDTAQIDTGDLQGSSFDDPAAGAPAAPATDSVDPGIAALQHNMKHLTDQQVVDLGQKGVVPGSEGHQAVQQELKDRGLNPDGSKLDGSSAGESEGAGIDPATGAANGGAPVNDDPNGDKAAAASANPAATPGTGGFGMSDEGLLDAAGWEDNGDGTWIEPGPNGSTMKPGPNGSATLIDAEGNEYPQPSVEEAINFHEANTASGNDEGAPPPRDAAPADVAEPLPSGDVKLGPEISIAPGTDLFSTDMSDSSVNYTVGSDGHLVASSPDGDVDYGVPVAEPDAANRLDELGFSADQLQDGEVFEYEDGSGEPAIIVNHGGTLYVGSGTFTGGATEASAPTADTGNPAPEPNSIPAGSSDGPQPNEATTAVSPLTRILGGPMGNASSKSQAAKMDELAKNIDAAVASGDLKSAQRDATKLQGMLPTEGVTPEEHPDIVAVQAAMAKVLAMKPSTLNDDGTSTPAALAAAATSQPAAYLQGAQTSLGVIGAMGQKDFVVEPGPTGSFTGAVPDYYILRPISSNGSKGDYGHFDSEEEAQAAQKGFTDAAAAWKEWGAQTSSGQLPFPATQEEQDQQWNSILEAMQGGAKPKDAVASIGGGSAAPDAAAPAGGGDTELGSIAGQTLVQNAEGFWVKDAPITVRGPYATQAEAEAAVKDWRDEPDATLESTAGGGQDGDSMSTPDFTASNPTPEQAAQAAELEPGSGNPDGTLGSSGVTLGELQAMSPHALRDLAQKLQIKGGDAKLIDAVQRLMAQEGVSLEGSTSNASPAETKRNTAIATGKAKG